MRSGAANCTPVLVTIANSFAEAKRILLIDIIKKVNRHYPAFPHAGEGAEIITPE
jgi:hypothetical protein